MFTFAVKQSSITQLWRDSISLYKSTFSQVWYLTLILGIAAWVLQYLTVDVHKLSDISSHAPYSKMILLAIVGAVAFFVHSYVAALIYHRMGSIAKGEKTTFAESAKAVFARFFSICILFVVIAIIIFLGLMLFILPGIFIAYLIMFAIPLVVCDHYSVFPALWQSIKLVWGKWWRTFIILLPVMIFFYGIYEVLLAGFDFHFLSFLPTAGITVSSIFLFLFNSIIYATILVQWNDLKLRKKGG